MTVLKGNMTFQLDKVSKSGSLIIASNAKYKKDYNFNALQIEPKIVSLKTNKKQPPLQLDNSLKFFFGKTVFKRLVYEHVIVMIFIYVKTNTW